MIMKHGSVRLIQQVNHFLEFDGDDEEEEDFTTRLRLHRQPQPIPNERKGVNLHKPTGNTTTTRERRRPKVVRFDLSLNRSHETSPASQEEIRQRWFRSRDVKGFRRAVVVTEGQGTKLRPSTNDSNTSSFRSIIKELFEEGHNSAAGRPQSDGDHSGHGVVELRTLSPVEERYVAVVKEWPELLGMERFALDAALKASKGQLRRQQLAMLNELPQRGTSFHMRQQQSCADYLYRSCAVVSHPSKAFARRIAQIHAMLC